MGNVADVVTDDFLDIDESEVRRAYEEAHYHVVLMDFEALLYKHGLQTLLKDMSDDGVFELLRQAQEINNAAKTT